MEATSAPDYSLFNEQLTNLDRAIALERVGGDLELLQEVARLFLDDYPKTMASIRQAVQSRDPKALERAAHNLKGAVSNFGAQATVEAAFKLEQMGKSGEMNEINGAFVSLETAVERLKPELVALIRENSSI